MKVLVLGIGKRGYGPLKDLALQPDIDEIVAADVILGMLNKLLSGLIPTRLWFDTVT